MADALFLISFLPCRPIGSLLVEAILPCKRTARMVDKRELANLLLGMTSFTHQCLAPRIRNHAPRRASFQFSNAQPVFTRRRGLRCLLCS